MSPQQGGFTPFTSPVVTLVWMQGQLSVMTTKMLLVFQHSTDCSCRASVGFPSHLHVCKDSMTGSEQFVWMQKQLRAYNLITARSCFWIHTNDCKRGNRAECSCKAVLGLLPQNTCGMVT